MAEAAVSPIVTVEALHGQPAPSRWPLSHRIFFRFVFTYFLLYDFPDADRIRILNLIPGLGFLTKKYDGLWQAVCPWVAIHIFHLSGQRTTYFQTGSGD